MTPPPDDWRPGAEIVALRARAAMLADIRGFFAAVGVLEVETPLACTAAGTDPALRPLVTRYRGAHYPAGVDLYLQTSPEFAMKRLLAAGSGPIYQVCKAFRDGEAGRLHNPEFSLLEWYRPGFGMDQLVGELVALLRLALGDPQLDIDSVTYTDLFAEALGVDVCSAPISVFQQLAADRGLAVAGNMGLSRDAWLDLLMSHLLQPSLGTKNLCCVTDYPATQAALARLNPDRHTAARFEVFFRGLELANGFHELSDAEEQASRFAADNAQRSASGEPVVPVDGRLLAALRQGLPDCSGVAVGLDRLLMLRLGLGDIDQVLSFSLPRC